MIGTIGQIGERVPGFTEYAELKTNLLNCINDPKIDIEKIHPSVLVAVEFGRIDCICFQWYSLPFQLDIWICCSDLLAEPA